MKDQVDQLAKEVNRITQIIDSSRSDNIKSCSKRFQRGSDKFLIAYCAPLVPKPDVWYFDSGCSCHMYGVKDMFLSLIPSSGDDGVFGGWYKS